ncbi:hypothetical protein TIFTF001_053001 [Ficus carica]|uniref:Secreted protein n=1 Tax=Ficus carica TaxID=3494 RepID=A0AA88EEP0_FICCA|nr:hypothetical protein TIFTF001_052994 [Ficus carica]GMN73252.1 hypothetical protein TIFTF001_052997 [Ficus carica]GMN73261.1 hypothetical protein TIFTF001_052998 [Ficus carica]GMN73269.1 hypothetical protein TIFTF001_053001 [Ficus carica]
MFFCLTRAWPLCPNLVFLHSGAHVLSGSVGCAPIPSSICCVAGALVTGPPSSLPFAYIVDLLPSPTPRQADAAPSEVWEMTANLWADYPLFPSSEINWPTRQFLP